MEEKKLIMEQIFNLARRLTNYSGPEEDLEFNDYYSGPKEVDYVIDDPEHIISVEIQGKIYELGKAERYFKHAEKCREKTKYMREEQGWLLYFTEEVFWDVIVRQLAADVSKYVSLK